MYIAETNSTNDLLKAHPEWITIRTDFQTAGRGQAGNGWESERGKNLLFSTLLVQPCIAVSEQFYLSMAVAVALRDVVAMCLPSEMETTIKWPNDIYVGDKKLAGILIEHQLAEGKIAQTVVGIGLNVNQEKWEGNAPNPTSLRLLTQQIWEIEPLMQAFLRNLSEEMQDVAGIKHRYLQHLYRRKGFYWYEEREVSALPTMNQEGVTQASFEAEFADVTPQGELCLCLRNGEKRKYHFKQIRFVV